MADAEQLDEILNNLPSALISLDPGQKVVYRNATAVRLAPQIEVGMNIWEALTPVVNEEQIDRVLRGERAVFKMGPDLPLLEWLLGDRTLAGGVKILMAWPAELTDEIVQKRITFIVGASHELRSPLTALLGFAEILELQSDTLTPDQAEAVRVIRQNAEYLHSMVDDVIDLTKNTFGELRLDVETLDVPAVVRQVAETLLPQIERKGQHLTVSAEPGLPAVDGDRHRIHQIVFNLLHNAHKHTPAGTMIEVRTKAEGDGVRITVSDDGPGLPFDRPEDAFLSFRRGRIDDHHDIAGSGIGLTVTQRVVELHRGTIEVRSRPGAGTAFTVWLPNDRDRARILVKPEQ